MDLATNYERIEKEFNISFDDFVEKDTAGKLHSIDDLYLKGLKSLMKSRLYLVLAGLLIATGIVLLFTRRKR